MADLTNTPKGSLKTVSAEDGASSYNTEDSLLSSSTNSQETISSKPTLTETRCYDLKNKKSNCGGKHYSLISAFLMIILAISSIIWTPLDILLNERINMRPGLPPFEWWKSPPDEVVLRMYVFNVTNSERFLSGIDHKLDLQEIGPIIFREKLLHNNVSFNENGTMTYVAKRIAIYLEDKNNVDLNATIIVPNFVILGFASYLWDSSIFTKFGLNILMENLNSQLMLPITIHDYLWNFSDPILDMGRNLLPNLVPVNNMGMLSRIYDYFEDVVDVYIGHKYGFENFMLIDKYDYSEYLPGHSDGCKDKLVGSSEGVAYPQNLTKDSIVKYWRKTICQVAPLKFSHEESKYGIPAYKYDLIKSMYNRTYPAEDDCYKGTPRLADGLVDVSKCYFDFPIASSFPHFLYGDDILRTYVNGLKPNETEHHSFALIEPVTGIPLEAKARSQSNLVIRDLSGFSSKLHKFSNMVVPMFWAEYHQVGLPWYISALVYFTVVLMPYLQRIATAAFFLLFIFFLVKFLKMSLKKEAHLIVNKALHFEKQLFLDKDIV